jgi:8-oxo-dGTP pyrophosphatase MutT (NUDIX family)
VVALREDRIHRIEVHVGCICLDGDRVLILKRAGSRSLCPGLWECGGGQVWTGESFEDAAIRELRDEAGVMAEPVMPVGTYEIPVPGSGQKKIPGIYFACTFRGYVGGNEPRISSEHTEWRWQPVDRLDGFEFIAGLREAIKKTHSLLKKTG